LRLVGENVLLAEKWQGKGKPPFHQFLQGFNETKNDLYTNGLMLNVDDQEVTVKVRIYVELVIYQQILQF
jgi:hypothetical protein